MQGSNGVALLLLTNLEIIMNYDLIEGYNSKNYGPNIFGDGVLPAWVFYDSSCYRPKHWAEFFAPETKTCQMSHWRWGQRWYMFNA